MFDEVMKRKDCGQLLLLSVLSLYLCMPQIPCALGCTAYSSVWWEGHFVLCIYSSTFPFQLSTVYKCDGCMSSRGRGGWLMAGSSDFASYQSSLHLGAVCQ